jgi:MFS family permease
MHANVWNTLCFFAVAGLGGALIDTVASNALYALMGANLWVGVAEGLQGLVQLLVAIPSGIYADKPGVSQRRMLRVAMWASWAILSMECLPLVAVLVCRDDSSDTCFAPPDWLHRGLASTRAQYIWLMVALSLSGAQVGFSDPALEALFANSMSDGPERTRIMEYRSMISSVSYTVGPLTALIIFTFMGDDWSLDTMATVWLVGLGIISVGIYWLGRFQDVSATSSREAGEHGNERDAINDFLASAQAQVVHSSPQSRLLQGHASDSSVDSDHAQESSGDLPVNRLKKERIAWIPYCCLTSSIVVAIGSGMTVKFWGLFYQHEIEFSPVQVNLVYICQGVLLVAIMRLSQRLRSSCGVGRLRLGLGLALIGLATLACVAALKDLLWESQPWVVAVMLMFRYALMNAGTPVFAAILTDHVAEEARSRWSSLDSVTTIGWCGSAALGGWLCDAYGYGVTFWITFGMQTLGTLLMLPILRHES